MSGVQQRRRTTRTKTIVIDPRDLEIDTINREEPRIGEKNKAIFTDVVDEDAIRTADMGVSDVPKDRFRIEERTYEFKSLMNFWVSIQ